MMGINDDFGHQIIYDQKQIMKMLFPTFCRSNWNSQGTQYIKLAWLFKGLNHCPNIAKGKAIVMRLYENRHLVQLT